MSRMGFQKKKYLDRGVGGWVELYPIFFWIFGIFLTLQSPLAAFSERMKYENIINKTIHARELFEIWTQITFYTPEPLFTHLHIFSSSKVNHE